MNASKEEAETAMRSLLQAAEYLDKLGLRATDRTPIKRHMCVVEEFLEAAKRKLPSEEAFARAKAVDRHDRKAGGRSHA